MSMVLNTETSLNKPSVWQRVMRRPAVVYFGVMAFLTAALFLVMGNASYAAGDNDLLKAGQATVNATVGKDSSVMKWLLMLEVLSAIFGYIATRNLKVLGGIIALSIFINICYSIIN